MQADHLNWFFARCSDMRSCMFSYAAFVPSPLGCLPPGITQLLSWRTNSTACLTWSSLLLPAGQPWSGSRSVASNWIHVCSSLSASGHNLYGYVRSVTIDLFPTSYCELVSGKFHASGFPNIHLCWIRVNCLQHDVQSAPLGSFEHRCYRLCSP